MREREIVVRAAAAEDAAAIARIYNHYVAETIITFEEDAVGEAEMRERIEETRTASLPWFVAVENGELAGYAYASRWKSRCAYRYSLEVTVYVDPARPRRGIGSQLYAALLPALRSAGYHAAMGGIALPNDASIRLHEKFGFKKVAHFKESGFKFGKWIDVGYWQLVFPARSEGATPP